MKAYLIFWVLDGISHKFDDSNQIWKYLEIFVFQINLNSIYIYNIYITEYYNILYYRI